MGTSQSISLKTTPNWAEAKRSMTLLTKPEGRTQTNFNRYLGSFSRAISSGGINVFGKAGTRASTNFVSLMGDIQSTGLQSVVEQIYPNIEFSHLSSKELLLILYQYIVGVDNANIDDAAAKAAMDLLLTRIFDECETPTDVETIIKETSQDQIDGWVIEYYVDYFMEFNAELFQTHIFEKESDPDVVNDSIRDFVEGWFQDNIKEEMMHINLFSEDGKRYLSGLTDKILSIWKQQ